MEKVPYFAEILTPDFAQWNPDVTLKSLQYDFNEDKGYLRQSIVKINKCILSASSSFLKECILAAPVDDSNEIIVDVRPDSLMYFADFVTKGELKFDLENSKNMKIIFDFMLLGVNLLESRYSSLYETNFKQTDTNYAKIYRNNENYRMENNNFVKGGIAKPSEKTEEYHDFSLNFEGEFDDSMDDDYSDIETKSDQNQDYIKDAIVAMKNTFSNLQNDQKISPDTVENNIDQIRNFEDYLDFKSKQPLSSEISKLNSEQSDESSEKSGEPNKNEANLEADIKLKNTDSCEEFPASQVKTKEQSENRLSRRRQKERLEFMGLDYKTFVPDEPGRAWKNFQITEDKGNYGKFKCSICFYQTDNRRNLIQHKLRHENIGLMETEGYNYFCTASRNCTGTGFFTTTGLADHFREVHKNNKEPCTVCKKMINSRYILMHQESEHEVDKSGPKYVCVHCGHNEDLTRGKAMMKYHVSSRGPYHNDKCEQCEVHFKSWSEKKDHIAKVHNGVRKYRCDTCGKVFDIEEVHRKHMYECKTREIKCERCGQMLMNKTCLRRHMQIMHSDQAVKQIQCEKCDKVCAGKENLRLHNFRAHTHAQPCEVCGKTITHYDMKRHLKHHAKMEDRPWGCEICSKRFVLKKALDEHKNIHTGERPFKCPLCDKSYSNSSNMLQHRKSEHFGIKRKHVKRNKSSKPNEI